MERKEDKEDKEELAYLYIEPLYSMEPFPMYYLCSRWKSNPSQSDLARPARTKDAFSVTSESTLKSLPFVVAKRICIDLDTEGLRPYPVLFEYLSNICPRAETIHFKIRNELSDHDDTVQEITRMLLETYCFNVHVELDNNKFCKWFGKHHLSSWTLTTSQHFLENDLKALLFPVWKEASFDTDYSFLWNREWLPRAVTSLTLDTMEYSYGTQTSLIENVCRPESRITELKIDIDLSCFDSLPVELCTSQLKVLYLNANYSQMVGLLKENKNLEKLVWARQVQGKTQNDKLKDLFWQHPRLLSIHRCGQKNLLNEPTRYLDSPLMNRTGTRTKLACIQSSTCNWARVAVLIRFLKAQPKNAIRFSILPLLKSICSLADVTSADPINLDRFMNTNYFTSFKLTSNG